MKIKYFIFTLIGICIFPFVAHADCDYQRQAELSRLASNVKISYSYEIVNNLPKFKVNIINLTNDIYISDGISNYYNQEIELSYNSGESQTYTIYSNDQNCYGDFLTKKYINLPHYNSYHNTEECQLNPNFKYCQMWGDFKITTTQFQNELTQYKTEIENNEKTEINKISIFIDAILTILKTNKIMIIILLIISIITITCSIVTKKRR